MEAWRCYMHRGTCHDKLGDLQRALADFDSAARLVGHHLCIFRHTRTAGR